MKSANPTTCTELENLMSEYTPQLGDGFTIKRLSKDDEIMSLVQAL